MKKTKLIMGMPITVEVVDPGVLLKNLEEVFHLFKKVDSQFSPYKKTSEVSRLNRKEIAFSDVSPEMKEILSLAEEAKKKTDGYFDVYAKGYFDPSGIVKSWAIKKAVERLSLDGFNNFYIDAGGDIQLSGKNTQGEQWRVGIRHPFIQNKIVKKVRVSGAIATSGTYLRGDHIYDPHTLGILSSRGARLLDDPLTLFRVNLHRNEKQIVSLTVIAQDVLTADLYATAAFAMGRNGIMFLERTTGVEGYMIDRQGMATYTSGFVRYVLEETPRNNLYGGESPQH